MNATRNILSFVWVVVATCGMADLKADFTFGEPVRFGSVATSDDLIDCLSADGLELYIQSVRAGGQGGRDMWVSKRASTEDDWGPPENLGPRVNSPQWDGFASISTDGLTLYFISSVGQADLLATDIYMTTRATKNDPWGPAVNLGATVNGTRQDLDPWISPDGLELYFMSYRSGNYGQADMWVTRRPTEDAPWGTPVNLGPVVNSAVTDAYLSLSPDGLLLFFSDGSNPGEPRRPGGYGNGDMWMSRRANLSAPWQTPTNLGPGVNGPSGEIAPRISPDGRTLYFFSQRGGGWEAWQAPIVANCDLNGDGKVNEKDVLVMTQHWGQDYPPCDIGPFPWGDGVVDTQDQMVLLETIEGPGFVLSPRPHTREVSRDVILSWTSPNFAKTHDVYFGTSFEMVRGASRGNPLGVLVSQGQTTTTYDPPGHLEFDQTYYWRIDDVGPAPDSTIYRGAVLDFTTEAFAYPIKSITASSSSAQPGNGPEKTVNGSGLDKNDGHSTDPKDMWWTLPAAPHWIQYEFDKVYTLHELWVWNFNHMSEPYIGFGARSVQIEYSPDGTTWTPLTNVAEFARAPGKPAYRANTFVSFGGVSARYVKLTIEKNWGVAPQTGLSEVRFFYVPVGASEPAPGSGRKGVRVDTHLTWKPGRQAVSHRVYFSLDRQALEAGAALAGTTADAHFDPGPLDLGRTYYWRVDEVNETATPPVRPGEIWSFTTKEYHVVDNFESYTDEEGSRIYQIWIDGASNKTGSQVGYPQSPFAERTVVHSGKQSMPLDYNNTRSPFYSQAERTFAPVQDWTVNGADTFTLWFRGNPRDFLQRADGSIQMSGGGADIWATSDQFRFAYRRLSGDGSVVARVDSLVNTHTWAKAGVMIRGNLDAASTYAFMTPTPEGRRAFQNRPWVGGSAVGAYSNAGAVVLPLWVKVERQGSNFTGYYSQDGKNWVRQSDKENTGIDRSSNPVTIAMMGDVYIGLAVTSHNVGMPTIAEFSDVSFTGMVTGPWQVEAIGVEQPSNDAAPLYLMVEDSAGHIKTLTHPDPAAVQAIDWHKWMIPFGDLQGVNLAGVKKMTIGVGNRNKPTAGGTGVIYVDDIGVGHPLSAE